MNDEKRISVVLVKAGCKAQQLEITGSLKSMQNIVKGNIEMVMPFDDDAALIVNEEGKIRGLPLNRALYDSKGTLADVIAGDFLYEELRMTVTDLKVLLISRKKNI